MYRRASRTTSFEVADLDDPDGLKTSFATATSPVTVTGVAFNGACVSEVNAAGQAVIYFSARAVTLTTGAHSGAYDTTHPIVVTGKYGGEIVTESFQPTNANGGQVLRGTQPFDTVLSVAIPTQAAATGTFELGVGDIYARKGDTFVAVRLHTDGTVYPLYDNQVSDTLPLLAGVREDVDFRGFITDPTLTPAPVAMTLYVA